MKGLILAGGSGTRLYPITRAVSKQLLPVYDKPMIFYPLSVLMLAGIQEILIISTPEDLPNFQKLLGDGKDIGLQLSYAVQPSPDGLAQAFIIGEKFIGKDNVSLILGDNFFFGQSLTKIFKNNINLKSGAKIFVHPVKNPQSYGVATLKGNKVLNLIEKPKKIKSNYAVTGLYFFDNKVVEYTKKLKPSKRNELEIIDLLNIYKKKNKLKSEFIGRGASWLDAGNIKDFYDASNFVETIENRQGLKIACLEEIALKNKWINKVDIKKSINFYGNCEYSKYLKSLINA